MVTAWIPMDDVEPSNGAMWMLPGSHTWGDQFATGSVGSSSAGLSALDDFGDLQMAGFEAPAVAGALPVAGAKPRPCPVLRGQVHFHHSLTWHGSPENASPNRRRAIGIH